MPYRYYHGRTGKIFHVVNRAVGILINKRVRYRIMSKRIYVRTEHIRPSKCRTEFVKRVKRNQKLSEEANPLVDKNSHSTVNDMEDLTGS